MLSSPLAAREADPILGHVDCKTHDDNIIITYSLAIDEGADAVWIEPLFISASTMPDREQPANDSLLIYSRSGGRIDAAPGHTEHTSHNRVMLSGQVVTTRRAGYRLRGCWVLTSGLAEKLKASRSQYSAGRWVEFPIGTLSCSIIPPIGGAWYKSTLDSATTKKGLAFGIEFNASFDIGHFRFEPSYRLTLGNDFTAKEAVPMSVRYYLGNRTDFLPSIFVAPKYSTLHVIKDKIDFEDKEWGIEAGLAIQGPFEQLSYSYCTGLGGYHKASLYLAVFRTGSWTAGTRYEYYHYDNTDMFRVMGVIEGFPMGGGTGVGHGATDLSYLNNRPIAHKVLAYAGMAPLVVAMFVLSILSTQ